MKHFLFLLVLLSFSSISAQEQDLKFYLGEWTGYSKQDPGGASALYDYRLVFESIEEEIIIGKAYVNIKGRKDLKGVIAFEASERDDELVVQYTKVLEDSVETGEWCLKQMFLKLSETSDNFILSGPWEAPDCEDGSSKVYRSKASRA